MWCVQNKPMKWYAVQMPIAVSEPGSMSLVWALTMFLLETGGVVKSVVTVASQSSAAENVCVMGQSWPVPTTTVKTAPLSTWTVSTSFSSLSLVCLRYVSVRVTAVFFVSFILMKKKHISYLTVAFVCQWLSGYISELVTCTGEDWFCSPDCATSDSQPRDAVLDYSRSVTCHGLLDMCHRDAVREADGQAMMTIWRVNMPRFWGGRHFKYLRVGHRLLAGIEFYNGCLYDATNC